MGWVDLIQDNQSLRSEATSATQSPLTTEDQNDIVLAENLLAVRFTGGAVDMITGFLETER